jgi:hypothetical protein
MVLALAWPPILGLDRIETESLLRCNWDLTVLGPMEERNRP